MQFAKSRSFGTLIGPDQRADPINAALEQAQSILDRQGLVRRSPVSAYPNTKAYGAPLHFGSFSPQGEARPIAPADPTELAQLIIPMPRRLVPVPWFARPKDAAPPPPPPKGPDDDDDDDREEKCEAQHDNHLLQCRIRYGTRLPKGRRACEADAFRVYSDCRTGRKGRRGFNPENFNNLDW